MNMTAILIAVAVVSVLGLIIGLLLGVAGKKFEVEVDERITQVREYMAGSNCGGCGFAGCDACAEAIVAGKAAPTACAPAGADAAEAIGKILGVSVEAGEKKVAFVRCAGTCDKTVMKSQYFGMQDCQKAALIPGSTDKACNFGCMGFGSCVKACKFDAIHVVNGVAVVDRTKCTGCTACTVACPRHIIQMKPIASQPAVKCSSKDKGPVVNKACRVGCIACGLCVCNCPNEAIFLKDNVAVIDYTKCNGCGTCVSKCPKKAIQWVEGSPRPMDSAVPEHKVL